MRFLAVLIVLLAPVPSFGIGQVYAGFAGEYMELTSAKVDVWIEDHIAVTRVEQVFTSHAAWQEEAVYQFSLPGGAIITDLWLWIEDEPVQALIMERTEARQLYESVVARSIDPALVEHVKDNQFVLRIFPFPREGSRRVALEYAQVLHSEDEQISYTFPLVPDSTLVPGPLRWGGGITTKPVALVESIKLITLNAHVKSQHPVTVTASGLPQNSSVNQEDPHGATVFFGEEDFPLTEDLHIRMDRTDDSLTPTLLSYGPGYHPAVGSEDIGYYLLWLPGYLYEFEVPDERKDTEFILDDFGMGTVDDPREDYETSDEHVMHVYKRYGVSQAGRYETGGPVSVWTDGHLDGGEVVSASYTAELAMDASDDSHAIRYLPRLWAHHKIKFLEKLAGDSGWPDELVREIVDLGIEYRLVTSHTSLFAPDESVEVDPEVIEGQGGWGWGATNVAGAVEARWLGHDFVLRDGLWVDGSYLPEMPREIYEGHLHQPALLAEFVELGREMVVVVDGRAYEIQPGRPILHQNAPNPFNSSTVITVILPPGSPADEARLGVYNLQGQLVRSLAIHGAGRQTVTWDGLDQGGRPVASGTYIYRLERGEWSVNRRMLLLR